MTDKHVSAPTAAGAPDLTRDEAKARLRALKQAAGGRGKGLHATFIKNARAEELRRAAQDPEFYDRVASAGRAWQQVIEMPRDTVPVYEPRPNGSDTSAAPDPAAPGLRSLVELLEEAEGALRNNSDELLRIADRIKRALS